MVEADAEQLPFADESFDVVMSAIGVMFAPHHQEAADELVRVCRPGGTIGLLSWTPEGMLGALFRDHEAVRAAPAARRPGLHRSGAAKTISAGSSAIASSYGASCGTCSRSRRSHGPATTASTSSPTTGRRSRRGRTPSAKDGRDEFDEALDAFCDEWNRGTPERGSLREGVPPHRRHEALERAVAAVGPPQLPSWTTSAPRGQR